jgi:hypothetical protein
MPTLVAILPILLCGTADSTAGWSLKAVPSASIRFEPVLPGQPWSLGDAESYGSNWKAIRVDPEVAHQWDTLPALAQLELGAAVDSFRLEAVLPIRRDLEAWATDPTGSNLLHGAEELDINAPYEGWVRWGGRWTGSLQAGRFRKSFSEFPQGVIQGSDLVHDAVWWRLPMGPWTFEWFASSLNPWLPGISGDGTVQPGSEADRQSTATIPNSRGRVYDEPYKTLFLHKLGVAVGDFDAAVVEQLLVGGRAPTWRDAVPFVAWHDNYGDGYSKVSTALDLGWHPDSLLKIHSQLLVEGTPSPVGETVGWKPQLTFAANAGWEGWWTAWGGRARGALDATTTSPTLNNYPIPLLKGISRRLYRSNNEDQAEPGFSDTWMVDQPLAYHRGPDAADLWSNWSWVEPGSRWGGGFELDFLQQGDADLWQDPETLQDRRWPLSGVVEREARARVSGWVRSARWTLQMGFGGSAFWNLGHEAGRDRRVGTVFGGAGWSL